MPLYTFKCGSCNHTFDNHLPMSEMKKPESYPCPSCGEMKVEKIIAGIGGFQADVVKPTGDFREVIQKIKKAHPKNTLPDY